MALTLKRQLGKSRNGVWYNAHPNSNRNNRRAAEAAYQGQDIKAPHSTAMIDASDYHSATSPVWRSTDADPYYYQDVSLSYTQ